MYTTYPSAVFGSGSTETPQIPPRRRDDQSISVMKKSLYLPGELIDATLQYIRDDKQALASCSLLSHHWCVSARPLLFQTVYILGRVSNKGFQAFLHFLQSSRGLARYIKELCLDGTPELSKRHTTWVQCQAIPTRLTAILLHSILSRLPNLIFLWLRALTWDSTQSDRDRDALPPLVPIAVPHLRVSEIEVLEHIYDALPDLFSLFSDVDHLRLSPVAAPEDSIEMRGGYIELLPPEALRSAPELRIKKVSLQLTGRPSVLDVIRVLNSPHALKELDVVHNSNDMIRVTQELLGPSLLSLRIRLSMWIVFEEPHFPMIDLSRCTSLQTVWLQFLIDYHLSPIEFTYALDILTRVSRGVQNIIFHLVLPTDEELLSQVFEVLDWGRMANLFSDGFDNLQNLSFILYHLPPRDGKSYQQKENACAEVLETVKQYLPAQIVEQSLSLSQTYSLM